jgi:hypothetical protein
MPQAIAVSETSFLIDLSTPAKLHSNCPCSVAGDLAA